MHIAAMAVGLLTESFGPKRKGAQKIKLTKPLNFVATVFDAGRSKAESKRETVFDAARLEALLVGNQTAVEGAESETSPDRGNIRLKTVQQLQNGIPLDKLVSRHKLIMRKHPKFPLVQLSYSQIESSMASPVVQECRGLILEVDTWKLVSFPFRKFFNFAEKHAHEIDWDTARVTVPCECAAGLSVLG